MPSKITSRRREEFTVRRSDEDLVHVVFDKEDDRVVQFSVQYLAFLQNEWRPIVRFDTAHGRAHLDISHPDGTQETRELHTQDYNAALTWAIEDLRTRWQFYRQRYEKEWKQ
ncbi:MAG: hypothetical protein HZC40_04795 [Chloroflexi bacterium]|nr:hypothetical protein [Chloroflexota bacterium]